MEKLSVIGLGKLSICTATCFASKGFKVIGVDVNKDIVDSVNIRRAPVQEPMLQELITQSKNRLKVTQRYEEAMSSDKIFNYSNTKRTR